MAHVKVGQIWKIAAHLKMLHNRKETWKSAPHMDNFATKSVPQTRKQNVFTYKLLEIGAGITKIGFAFA